MNLALDHAQATVVGCVIEKPDLAGEVFSIIAIEDLDGQYRAMAEAIHGLRLAKADISRLSVADEMSRRGTLSRIGGEAEVGRVAGFGFGDHQYALDALPHCDAELRLAVTSEFVVEDTLTPVSDLAQRHSIVDSWEVVCIEGHIVDSGCHETDGRQPLLGLRSAMSLGGLR